MRRVRGIGCGVVGFALLAVTSAGATPDTTPPDTTITVYPSHATRSTSASFSFTATETNSTFACARDGAAFTACTSPTAYTALAEGSHAFTVRATDASGNTDTTPAQWSWTVDLTAPSPTGMVAPTARFMRAKTFGVSWMASDALTGIRNYDVKYRRAKFSASTYAGWTLPPWQDRVAVTSVTLTSLVGYTYCFSMRARDRAGNISAYSRSRCTSVPVNNTSFTHSSGWQLLTGSGYYLNTFSYSSYQNASMSLSGVIYKHLALLATTCPSCGTVGVYRGSTLLATVSLVTSTTIKRHVIPVANTTTVTTPGLITIRVMSSGKPVRIEGLGVSLV